MAKKPTNVTKNVKTMLSKSGFPPETKVTITPPKKGAKRGR